MNIHDRASALAEVIRSADTSSGQALTGASPFSSGAPPSKPSATRRHWVFACILIAGLLGLIWFSHRLAGIRIYQVDECENVYIAKVLASGQAKNSYAFVSLLHFPLSWVSHGATQAIDRFVAGRSVMRS